MTGNRRYKLMFAGGLVLLLGISLALRTVAEVIDEDSPPTITAAPASSSLLPEDFPAQDVEMFGNLLSAWDADSVRVIHYRGDFRLHFERRRLSADNAVIWIRPEPVGGRTVKHFTIYMEGNVRLAELGGRGTTLTDAKHLVTLATTGRIWTDADTRGEPDQSDSPLYKRAKAFRDRVGAGGAETVVPSRMEPPPPVQTSPSPLQYQADKTTSLVQGDERIILAEGRVYLSRAEPGQTAKGKLFVEMRASRAVLFARESKVQEATQGPATQPDWRETITGAYLEGDVILSRGERTIQGARLFYDFDHDRALILDAVTFERHESREVPIIIWADQIRQLSQTETVARNALITTSEMHTPQYDIRARKVYLRDETDRPEPYASARYNRVIYKTTDEQFRVRGIPLTRSLGSEGTLEEQPTALRTVRVGLGSEFGPYIDAQWDAFKLLNLKAPEGFKAYLDTAYYGSRGPWVGLEGKYKRENFYGYFVTSLVWDRGGEYLEDDQLPVDDTTEEDADREKDDKYHPRGRVLARHRHYLKNDWELTAELSFLSDRMFLEDWYRSEFDTGKEQETLVYAKKTWDNNAFTALVKARINSFLNQTEKLPEVKYYKLGEPLWNDRLVYFSENSAGVYNYAVDVARKDRTSSGALARGDTRHEVQLPLRKGPFQIVPYAVARLTGWSAGSDAIIRGDEEMDGTADESADGGGGNSVRLFGAAGVKTATMFSRTFDQVESRFWDVHRLRHLIKPELNLHLAANSVEREDLLPLDPGVESIVGSSAVTMALRQRLQTKRGGPGAWRNVDWMILDLEGTLFANDPTKTLFEPEFTRPRSARNLMMDNVFARGEFFDYRPENSLARSTFNWFYQWRVSDTFTLLWDGNLGEGGLDRNNFGVAIERSPRWKMYFGSRYIAALDSNDLVFQTAYKINRKYDLLFSYAFDTIAGEMASTQVTLVRKMQRLYVALTFDVSNIQERKMVMISIWPEGAPELHFGPRYQSTFGTTTSSTLR